MGPFNDGWTKEQVLQVLSEDKPADLLYVPIVVGMSAPDCGAEWAAEVCFSLCSHKNEEVRANALLGLGHIARTAEKLDLQNAREAVLRALVDSSSLVQAQASEAASDIKRFMRLVQFP